MLRAIQKLKSRRGNVTSMWIAGLPIFMFMFLCIGSMVTAWVGHSQAQVAADGASLAVTKKLDALVEAEIQRQIQIAEARNAACNCYVDPWYQVLGTPQQRQALVAQVITTNQGTLISTAKDYLARNHASTKGKLTIVKDHRVQVEAQVKYHPLIFQDRFKDVYVKGKGSGPVRRYLKWLNNRSVLNQSF
ncbi:Tad domain-containing protein [Hazenella coriacea]|uniref:Putative Flp pilus-assembly TadE/G-like protein n=1 Tax=Hazenella coriacea TaxID=1179467 RepID=A0A4R3L5K2_9BACL|nr:Tad domain-containing protein [Hazenella coriacea]TCS94255.1 putative Flp pilus-assembly TadE/G-like protein [Hazenella coriacea]